MSELINTFIQWFSSMPDIVEALIVLIGSIVTAASAISAATPTEKDDAFMPKLKRWKNNIVKVLNVLALNVGNAKPKNDPKK